MKLVAPLFFFAGLLFSLGALSVAFGAEPGSGSSGCDANVNCNNVAPDGTCIGSRHVNTGEGGMCVIASGASCTTCRDRDSNIPCPPPILGVTYHACKCTEGEPYQTWDACVTCVAYDNTGFVAGVSCSAQACPPVGAECEELYDTATGDGECKCVSQ